MRAVQNPSPCAKSAKFESGTNSSPFHFGHSYVQVKATDFNMTYIKYTLRYMYDSAVSNGRVDYFYNLIDAYYFLE